MPLVNEADLDWTDVADEKMRVRRKQLGEAAGSDQLGCSLYELPPGEASWPYHYHTANEEALYVLTGTGMLRLDGETQPLRAGDYAALPADESGGHKVINDSEGPLRYLVVSTMNEPDVTVYPDSGKVGVFVGAPPGGRDERSHHGYYRVEDAVDYWDGE
ncbi:cupin domain-containing protein [Halobacterium sp. KA-6]|uniref:cupin domain-containing protein n=1 Tax=Halobacterium sp. KA-6 TaxID=2896368 RepID=UPI001E3C3C22|nr:cupin domain-containing protein [Halobacterium sp. KA-6]MCD2203550.1 cupin domain-containing protein [Halobacterium sp. KA-6]